MIEFFVPGIPATAGSKKPFLYKGKDGKPHASMAPDNKRQKPWMAMVATAAQQAMRGTAPLTGAVSFEAHYVVQRPRGHFGTGKNTGVVKESSPPWPTTKPDLSKMTRAVEDALTGIVWRDDSQVVESRQYKRYGEKPGVHIRIVGVCQWRLLYESWQLATDAPRP